MSLKHQKGIALVEVLVAVAILAVGMLAVVSLQIDAKQNSSLAKQRSEAVNLGRAKLEELRNFKTIAEYLALADGSDIIPASALAGANATYTRSWTVTVPGGAANYRTVVLQVNWIDTRGIGQSVNLRTIIRARDPATAGKMMNTQWQ